MTLKPSAYCEFSSNQSTSHPVRGNIAKCYDAWVHANRCPGSYFKCYSRRLQNSFYRPSISQGYPLQLSALKEREFVSKAIFDLLKSKCVEVLDRPPAIVNPLSVSVQSSGKKRLILELRHVNLYILKQKFKCEDL